MLVESEALHRNNLQKASAFERKCASSSRAKRSAWHSKDASSQPT